MPLFKRKKPGNEPSVPPEATSDYSGRLALVGKQLDKKRHRSVAIVEVSENYIIRGIDPKSGIPKMAELLAEDFTQGDTSLSISPSPSSYESILAAIGKHLDSRAASNVAIMECPSCYQIVGWESGHSAGQLASLPFEATLDRHSLERLVSENR